MVESRMQKRAVKKGIKNGRVISDYNSLFQRKKLYISKTNIQK